MDLHDRYRVTRGGKPTHKHVMQSFRLLQRYRIPCDILCVVHRENVRHPAAVYRFVKEMGADYLQFLPLVARQDDHGVRAETVPAEAYGAFLCTVFHEWVRHDVGRIGIQNFGGDETVSRHGSRAVPLQADVRRCRGRRA